MSLFFVYKLAFLTFSRYNMNHLNLCQHFMSCQVATLNPASLYQASTSLVLSLSALLDYPSVCMSVCLSVCLVSVCYLYVCLSICSSACLFVGLSVYQLDSLSVHPRASYVTITTQFKPLPGRYCNIGMWLPWLQTI